MYRFGMALMIVVSVLAAGMATAQEMPRTISVTGTGVVDTAPDMALISLAVTHEAKTAGDAMAQVSDDMTALLARLQTLGLDGKDIQTNRLSISPVWDNRRYENGHAPRITGFVASNGLSLRVRDLGALGGILDAVIADGANEMSGLRFTVDDPKPHQDAARARAVADAMDKAQQLANAAGVALGPLRTMSEHGGGRAPVMMEMAAARSADVPIAAGEVSLSVSVAMVFDILP